MLVGDPRADCLYHFTARCENIDDVFSAITEQERKCRVRVAQVDAETSALVQRTAELVSQLAGLVCRRCWRGQQPDQQEKQSERGMDYFLHHRDSSLIRLSFVDQSSPTR